jgi:hypothetical protein
MTDQGRARDESSTTALRLGTRAHNALWRAGVRTVQQLKERRERRDGGGSAGLAPGIGREGDGDVMWALDEWEGG